MKLVETMMKNIESFLEKFPIMNTHMDNEENPHRVTKVQVGLSDVKNAEQATKEEFNNHVSDKSNPHQVTKVQVGLGNVENVKQATKTEFDTHCENQKNPHKVTKEQIGLSEVTNNEQATKEQYQNHINGIADKHFGSDILYSKDKSVTDKIKELILEGGGGSVYHDELLNRDKANQHPMKAIENAGEILLFEGVTQGETEVDLHSNTISDFVSENGYIACPDGVCADIEISVVAAYGEDGKISENGRIAAFRANTMITKINSLVRLADTTFSKMSLEENNYSVIIKSLKVYESSLRVKGVEGKTTYWRGIVRVKNILNIGTGVAE